MSNTNKITILIVEDSPTQAFRLQYLLENHDYNVVATENGQQALDWLANEKPAIIISDIIMPEINGFELCDRIKKDEKTKYIPVILLTSLSEPDEVIDALSCGADCFINKPFSVTLTVYN